MCFRLDSPWRAARSRAPVAILQGSREAAPYDSSPAERPMTRQGRLTRRDLLQTGTGLAAVVASSVGGQATAQASRPPPQTAGPDAPGRVTPARAALAIEHLPALARDLLARTGVPGMSVAVVYDDTVTLVDGLGVRQLGESAAVDGDTVFQL